MHVSVWVLINVCNVPPPLLFKAMPGERNMIFLPSLPSQQARECPYSVFISCMVAVNPSDTQQLLLFLIKNNKFKVRISKINAHLKDDVNRYFHFASIILER